MNTVETVALIITLGIIALFALGILASAMEWLNISLAASAKAIPAAKRKPRKAVEYVQVIPGIVEQPEQAAAPVIAAARRTG